MKLLHLVSDDKFIDSHIDKFDVDCFDNVFVYLKTNKTYKGKNTQKLKHVSPLSSNYWEYIRSSKDFDGLVTNGLGYYQSLFINELPRDLKVFWCFFGAEIYNNPKIWDEKDLYAPETLNILKRNRLYFFLQKIYHFRFYLKYKKSLRKEIARAITRCDYFMWYIKEEYQMLVAKSKIKLPEFKYLSIINREADLSKQYSKKDVILLGNSGSESNNHIDALKILHESKCNCQIKIPFSYGVKSWYKQEVLKFLTKNGNQFATLIEDFMPYDQYLINFEEAKAGVYPSYRQMGLGNIIMCIRSGVKIYLSEKNPIYEWFKNNELLVYSIDSDLRNDILTDNLQLNQDEIVKNKVNWNKLGNKQNKEQFAEMIKGSIK